MSFRHDKTRGNHPITPKKGIKEVDLNIKEKGNNDRIVVSVKPNSSKTPDALIGNMHWQWNKLSVTARERLLEKLYPHMEKAIRKRIASFQDLNDVLYGNHPISHPDELTTDLQKLAKIEKNIREEQEFNKKNFAKFWDEYNEWKQDDLYSALSGRYKNEKIYDQKVEEYYDMNYNDMPKWLQTLLQKEMEQQDIKGIMEDKSDD